LSCDSRSEPRHSDEKLIVVVMLYTWQDVGGSGEILTNEVDPVHVVDGSLLELSCVGYRLDDDFVSVVVGGVDLLHVGLILNIVEASCRRPVLIKNFLSNSIPRISVILLIEKAFGVSSESLENLEVLIGERDTVSGILCVKHALNEGWCNLHLT